MKILGINIGEEPDTGRSILRALDRLGYETEIYPAELDLFRLNDEDIDKLAGTVKEHGVTHMISVHLVNICAVVSDRVDVKYIAYIWDAPYVRLYSPFGRLSRCYYALFDRLDCERFRASGIRNVMYTPLAVDAELQRVWNRKTAAALRGGYMHDVCFLGRLYENNDYDKNLPSIPDDMRRYFESIFAEAAFRWDGVNRIYGKTSQELLDYIRLCSQDFTIETNLDIDDVTAFERFYLVRKIANIERIAVLNTLAETYSVWLHTSSKVDPALLGKVQVGPPVFPGDASALLFAGSRINLNISLKGIEGGTPQRVMDVLGAGGFMLSSYGPETAEIFEEDKEIVMFKSPEELFDKVGYYLRHEKERQAIARRGQKRVLDCYTYDRTIKKIMDWVES